MKLSVGVKRLLIARLSNELEKNMSVQSFNILVGHLDKYMMHTKFSLYDVYENLDSMPDTIENNAFKMYLTDLTSNIPKNQNKGRKLVRELGGVSALYGFLMPFGMGLSHVFPLLISVFSVEVTDLGLSTTEEAMVNSSFTKLKQFLLCLVLVDSVDSDLMFEKVLEIFLNSDRHLLMTSLVEVSSEVFEDRHFAIKE